MAAFDTPGPQDPRSSVVDLARQNSLAPVVSTESRWLRPTSVDGSRFNRLYPYQLLVVEQQADGSYARKRPTSGTSWQFNLPIPPEALAISTPFAISTEATLDGYVEKHAGIAFRTLTLSGSFGTFFGRAPAPVPDFSSLTSPNSIFGGTISAGIATASAVGQVGQDSAFVTNTEDQATFADPTDNGPLTGYYQFRLLQAYFEAYAELKRTKDGRRARLAFAIWKHEEVYLCAPQAFDVTRSASSPLGYRYSIVLRANKRVRIAPGATETIKPYVPVQRDPSKLGKLLRTVEQARVVLQDAKRTIAAVDVDVEHDLFEPMRELCLLAKDALAVPLSLADLSDSIIQDAKQAVLDLKSTGSAVSNFPQNLNRRFGQVSKEASDADEQIGLLAAEQGDDSNATAASRASRSAHPANTPFLNPSDNFDLFSSIQVGDLHLSPATTTKVAAERARVRNLTRLDFERRRDSIAVAAATFSRSIGMGSPAYDALYGLDPVTNPVTSTPTTGDLEAVYALNDLIVEISRLAVSTNTDPNPRLDSVVAIAGLAQRSSIAFTVPRSKFAVPFPYGSTLEMLAARYLGDPERWFEIAALNGLQTPYVDEEGFELPLLVNGAGNTVVVASRSQLFVGQPVWVSSTGATRTKRRIVAITRVTDSQFRVRVDGDADLERYGTAAGATLQAFAPNTVNSQAVVYIPSDEEPQDDELRTKAVAGVDEYDQLLAVGGIDLLLTSSGDLVVGPEGDSRWATGLANITQMVVSALRVTQGTLMGHKGYGLPIKVGQSLADLDATALVAAAQSMFADNATFAGIRGAHVDVNGPVAKIGLAVEIAGIGKVVPVSADVKR